jgi:uncharacterized protein with WD repeat
LSFGEIVVDRLQGLQRDHCAVVGQNTGHILWSFMYGALHRVGWKLRKFTAARCVILTEFTGDFVPVRLCGDVER